MRINQSCGRVCVCDGTYGKVFEKGACPGKKKRKSSLIMKMAAEDIAIEQLLSQREGQKLRKMGEVMEGAMEQLRSGKRRKLISNRKRRRSQEGRRSSSPELPKKLRAAGGSRGGRLDGLGDRKGVG